jgi:hypothetical protein
MNKQTAVEWLVDIVERYIENLPEDDLENLSNLFDQAKQMEKEQIELSNSIGFEDGCHSVKGFPLSFESAEQYYNETYGGQDE